MGSKGRIPPHLRRPLPGPGMMHLDLFGPGGRPPPGPYPPFDALPPVDLLEQKLDAQQVEMQTLATENQRLAATHGTLRHEVAAGQEELKRLQFNIGDIKHERDRHMSGLMDNISRMEADLQAAEPIKKELQKAHAEAQGLVVARQELMEKLQQLTRDLQRTQSEVQVPVMISELENLRQEYQRCRDTYDYEKDLYNEHFTSIQVMENNYISMSTELEKLRAELANTANLVRNNVGASYGGPTGYKDTETAGNHAYGGYKENEASGRHPYGAPAGYKENEAAGHYPSYGVPAGKKENESVGHPAVQNPYENGYGATQGRGAAVGAPPPPPPPYGGPGAAAAPAWAGYDPQRGAGYDPQRGPVYDPSRGQGYDAAAAVRGQGYDTAAPRSGAGPQQGQMGAPPNHAATYGSVTPPTRAVGGYDAPSRGGNMTGRS
ncbi:hypothetical protein ACHQM5_009056 [Ranunculus cassubicifolius]